MLGGIYLPNSGRDMNNIVTPVCLELDLIEVLKNKSIEPIAYGRAYGISAGLDLYNVGPEVIIRPIKASESSE